MTAPALTSEVRLSPQLDPAGELRDGGDLPREDHDGLARLLTWFNLNLPAPAALREPRAVFWFKGSSNSCSRRVWELATVLRRYGVAVEVLKTRRPGYVEYEDRFQVGAVPFRDTLRA